MSQIPPKNGRQFGVLISQIWTVFIVFRVAKTLNPCFFLRCIPERARADSNRERRWMTFLMVSRLFRESI